MNNFTEICHEYILSTEANLKGLFSTLLEVYIQQVVPTYKDHISESSKHFIKSELSLPVTVDAINTCFLSMNNDSRQICLNSISSVRDRNDESIPDRADLYISLLRLVEHDVEITIGKSNSYSSKGSCLDECLNFYREDVFNELLKCRMDLNAPNGEISDASHTMHKTLFSEVILDSQRFSGEPDKNFAIRTMLASEYDNQDKANRNAINSLFNSLNGATICAEFDLKLEDYKGHGQYSHSGNYIDNTINSIYEGFSGEVDTKYNHLSSDYELSDAEKKIAKLAEIKAILEQEGAREKVHLKPFFNTDTVYNVIITKIKEINKNSSYRNGKQTIEKMSETLAFFENLIGVGTLICNDMSRVTATLFKLSKSSYGGYLTEHYASKLGIEVLAKNATGVEQAKFIMELCGSDPITVMTLVEKESVKKQLMEEIGNL